MYYTLTLPFKILFFLSRRHPFVGRRVIAVPVQGRLLLRLRPRPRPLRGRQPHQGQRPRTPLARRDDRRRDQVAERVVQGVRGQLRGARVAETLGEE